MSLKMERLVPLLSLVLALVLAGAVALATHIRPMPWAVAFAAWTLFGRSCVLHWSALSRFQRLIMRPSCWRKVDFMRWWREAGCVADICQNFRHAQLAAVILGVGLCSGAALLLRWAPINDVTLGTWIACSVYGGLAGRVTHKTIAMLENRDA